jgi:hypothetical protein
LVTKAAPLRATCTESLPVPQAAERIHRKRVAVLLLSVPAGLQEHTVRCFRK